MNYNQIQFSKQNIGMIIQTERSDRLQKLHSIFQNQIQKRQTLYNMQLHRNRLNDTMRSTKRSYFLQKDYTDMLHTNKKREYFDQRRDDEIQRENVLLFGKIAKINDRAMRYGSQTNRKHGSLNSYVRKVQKDQISTENLRMYHKLVKLKPNISYEETSLKFKDNRKVYAIMSKIEKFRPMDQSQLRPINHLTRSSVHNEEQSYSSIRSIHK